MSIVSDDAPCGTCQEDVCTNHKALDCDICESWYHIDCATVSMACYATIRKNSGMVWICPSCRLALHSTVTKTRELDAENCALKLQISEIHAELADVREASKELMQVLDNIQGALGKSQSTGTPLPSPQKIPVSSSCPVLSEVQTVDPGAGYMPRTSHERGSRGQSSQAMHKGATTSNTKTGVGEIQIRYIRNICKDIAVPEIRKVLLGKGFPLEDTHIEQIVPQEEFKGTKKFVRVVLQSLKQADDFAKRMPEAAQMKWQFSRSPPTMKKAPSAVHHNKKPQGITQVPEGSHSSATHQSSFPQPEPTFLGAPPPQIALHPPFLGAPPPQITPRPPFLGAPPPQITPRPPFLGIPTELTAQLHVPPPPIGWMPPPLLPWVYNGSPIIPTVPFQHQALWPMPNPTIPPPPTLPTRQWGR